MVNKTTGVARRTRNNEPDYIAQTFIESQHMVNGKETLHYYHKDFWRYTGTHWERMDDDSVRSDFHAHFVEEVARTEIKVRNGALENAALAALKARTTLDGKREMPSWLNASSPVGAADHNFVAFQNGILHLPAAMRGIVTLAPHTSEWFSTTCLPFNYAPEAECPNWLLFLEGVFEEDEERIALLQEWAGYLLTPDTSRHKFMLFEGVARAGKGVISNVLTALLGEQNVATIRLENFSDRFQLLETVGKLLNVVDEADKIERFQEGVFKTYVAGGRHYFDVKGTRGFQAIPTARVLILTNERIPIMDKSDGMWQRMLLLPFRHSAAGKENLHWQRILSNELAGIFNWALEGLARLRKRDDFTEPRVSAAEKAGYKKDSNPARAWLAETYEKWQGEPKCSGEWVTRRSLYEGYVMMCKEEGIKWPLSMTTFNREVRAAFSTAVETQTRQLGERLRVWKGIREKG